jgi:hypothetical protein
VLLWDMAFHVNRFFLVITFWLALSGLHPASACDKGGGLTQETVDASATIYRGKIAEYEIIDRRVGKLRFVVTETYRGQSRDEWTLLLLPVYGNFLVPEDLEAFRREYGDDTVVGVTTPLRYEPGYDFGPRSAEIFALPRVMEEGCGPPFMFKWDERSFKYLVDWGVVFAGCCPSASSGAFAGDVAKKSQLETRLSAIPAPGPKDDNLQKFEVYWREVAETIQASDAITDFMHDANEGIIGIMTTGGDLRRTDAPGLNCSSKNYVEAKAIYYMDFPDAMWPGRQSVYDTYTSYAAYYNREALRRSADVLSECSKK